jgi:O-acetyl-ADP-ribose deacetylase (regulator of RNase III)
MPIRYVSGDLFANAHHAEALAHGCNCKGSMGAGIAVGFRERYPEMFEQYRDLCKSSPRRFNPGDCFLYKSDDQPWVFNLATQEDYWHDRATYAAIETALTRMREQADAEGVTSIALPRVGAGKGGLSWKKVKAVIERVLGDWPGTLIVYEDYVEEKAMGHG